MRTTVRLVASGSLLLLFVACGGGIAPSGNGDGTGDGTGASGGTGTAGTTGSSGAASTGGGAQSNPNMPTGGGAAKKGPSCTVGGYVFCRCDDGSEGTKECLPDRGFGACACNDLPPPQPCSYPVPNNPPDCPAMYSHKFQGQPCPTLNLVCSYPGQGDPEPTCAATARLQCRVAPGGAMFWVATQ